MNGTLRIRFILLLAVVLAAWFFFVPTSVAYADTIISSNISTNTTWDAIGNVYVISLQISIDPGVTLTVDPGVIVKFENGASLTAYGTLDVNGTSGNPVHFTSYKDDSVGGDTNSDGASTSPAPGDWEQIAVQSGGDIDIDNATIRYGGQSVHWSTSCDSSLCNFGGLLALSSSTVTYATNGISPNYGTTTIEHSLVSDSSGSGMYKITGNGSVSVATSTFQNNNYDGITVSGGGGMLSFVNSSFVGNGGGAVYIGTDISFENSGNNAIGNGYNAVVLGNFSIDSTRTWMRDDIPYLVIYTSIGSSGNVTVEPGTVIKHAHGNGLLNISGTFNVQGTLSDPVYITSSRDDSVGGDTNSDGSATSPTAGDWENILVQTGGNLNMAYAKVRYGGLFVHLSTSGDSNIFNKGGIVEIASSTISNSTSYIFNQTAGTTTVWGSNIEASGSGTAVYNQVSATSTFIAIGNYWGGGVTGPYHTTFNPTGEGNAVSDYVDFTPWTSRYLLRFKSDCISLQPNDAWDQDCTSVENGEVRWGWYSSSTQGYVAELNAATSTWTNEGPITIKENQGSPTVLLRVDNFSPEEWRGQYTPANNNITGLIDMNTYILANDTSSGRQNTWTHEFGHTLGLSHSLTGNVMYESQTQQTSIGLQDKSDYHYIWSY